MRLRGLRGIAVLAPLLCANHLHAQARQVPEPDSLTRRHLSARRTAERITIDGVLAEGAWLTAPVARDFMQVRQDFVPTTRYPSEVRVLYDDAYLYVGAYNRDSAGLSTLRMQDLRRDFDSPESDVFGVTFGSLGDGRTSFQFQVSPLGSQGDVQAFDGGDAFNFTWDALWRTRTTRSDSGWTVEMAIPWTSLKYRRGLQTWDLNFVRNTRRVLQWSAWAPFPRQWSSWRLRYSGVLDSLEPPPPRTNVRIRPYALGQALRDAAPNGFNGSVGDVGGEIIWAPTASSLLEGTINTDFAQADVDRQVINLTRFNVFFPEQRQFFLENADLLSAGGLTGRPTGSAPSAVATGYVVQPFFSRRIGLDEQGVPLPIVGGARYAYRTGRSTAGVLLMQQDGSATSGPSTFGVARASGFFGRSTRIGAMLALRDDAAHGATEARENVVTSIDAITRIGEQMQLNGTVSTSTLDGRTGLAVTYNAQRTTPFSAIGILGALVTQDYAPRTGFVSRPNVLLSSPSVAITLQPKGRPGNVVWFKPGIAASFFQDPKSFRLQEGVTSAGVEVLHTNGAVWRPFVEFNQQRPDAPVPLFPGVVIPAGTHDFWRGGIESKTDQSARIALTANLSAGGFFDGTLGRVALAGRWSPNPYVALRANYELNQFSSLGTTDTAFVTHLAGPELRLFASPRLQWSAFYQYNTAVERGSLNARFSWEFRPLSFLYVVYNDRQAIQHGMTPTARSLIVKLTWLLQL